jgi:hypothetical protein
LSPPYEPSQRLKPTFLSVARRESPQAMAFIGDRNGKQCAYLVWAPPACLLDGHVTAVPDFGEAYDLALSNAAQWQIGTPVAGQLITNGAEHPRFVRHCRDE